MSATRMWMATLLLLALLPGTSAEAQGYCDKGAVNTITANYGHGPGAVSQDTLTVPRSEICVAVEVQIGDGASPGGWQQVATICDLWTEEQAYDLMFAIGQCGLIAPVFEGVGQFYGVSVPVRAEARRQQ